MTSEEQVALLRRDIAGLAETAVKIQRDRNSDRKALKVAAVAVVLVIATLVTVIALAVTGYDRLKCQNDQLSARQKTSEQFYLAERDKVAGQIKGLIELRDSAGNQDQASEGFNKFIDASQTYLTYVDNKLETLKEAPATQC